MKSILYLFLSASFFFTATAIAQTAPASAKPMLSPGTKHYLAATDAARDKESKVQGYVYKTDAAGTQYLSALIKITVAAVADSGLRSLGAKVGTRAGNIWTVRVPVAAVGPFTELPGIAYVQLDEPLTSPKLDVARRDTKVDSAQAGYNLPIGYSGKNVVVGVIDFGFDYNHPVFYDTTGSRYRIKRVWEMNGSGSAPAPYGYGKEITDTTLIKAEGTDNTQQIHGTSTSSIAAGSGYGSAAGNNRKYRGMAYDADVVLVGVRRDSIGGQWMNGSFTDFIDGINYIFTYAAAAGKPAVVNISWGSQSGPHDGTTLFNQACDNLAGKGKAIVMSAGNEGQEHIHLAKTFTATDTTLNTFLTFTPATYKRTWVDIWGDPGQTFCANTTLYHGSMVAGNTTGFICLDNNIHNQYLIAANGADTCYVEYINTLADLNGKSHMLINIWNKSTDSIGISVKGTSGHINMWDEYYYYGYTYAYQSAFSKLGQAGAMSGDTAMTTSDMGSGQKVLLVGAYSSRPSWTTINNQSYYIPGAGINRIAPFSSIGPTVDGRIKPDITAPGLMVITAVNSKDTAYTATGTSSAYVVSSFTDGNGKTYYYGAFDGTSASSPVAAGIVALLLQADPTLSPDQIKAYIFQSAIQDAYTDVLPATGDNVWGHGKIDAYNALKLVVQHLGVYEYKGKKLDCVLFPNPNNGHFTLDYTGPAEQNLKLEVLNSVGSIVLRDEWHVGAGHTQRALDAGNLAKGIYMVRVSSPDGSVGMQTVVR